MALIRVDWNPSGRKVRQFGLLLALFSVLSAAWWAWRGHGDKARIIGPAGAVLGLLCAALPGALGRPVYMVWMGASFLIGCIVSPILMGLLFYGLFTPLGLLLRLLGRDALRLKRPAAESYWVALF